MHLKGVLEMNDQFISNITFGRRLEDDHVDHVLDEEFVEGCRRCARSSEQLLEALAEMRKRLDQ